MRKRIPCALLLLALAGVPQIIFAQQARVVDRIVARIEDDILTLSELRELGRFQQLVNSGSAPKEATSEEELLRQLIDQWIVNTEASVAQFPHPTKQEVQAEVEVLMKKFASSEAYRARLKELELTPESVARQVEKQIFLGRFLDYKLRPAASVAREQVEKYYREELIPELKKRGQAAPPLESVDEQIRELLTQREISARAAKWLDETRARLKIEIAGKKTTP